MWNVVVSAALLNAIGILGETPRPSTADSASNVWYAQIGTWHHITDTTAGTAYVYHNAAVDGARSGMARADLKFNRQIRGIARLSVNFSAGRASIAGVVLKNRNIAYGVTLQKYPGGDTARIIRRFEKQQTNIAAFAVIATDTQQIDVLLSADSLRVFVGKASLGIRRPADLPAEMMVALSCEQGEVRVWKVLIEAPSFSITETFVEATVFNLGMERMFRTGRKTP